jgi:hypothetical protein
MDNNRKKPLLATKEYLPKLELCLLLEEIKEMELPLKTKTHVPKLTAAQLERFVNGTYDS